MVGARARGRGVPARVYVWLTLGLLGVTGVGGLESFGAETSVASKSALAKKATRERAVSSEPTNLVWVAPLTSSALTAAATAELPVGGADAEAEAVATNRVEVSREPVEGAPREVMVSITDIMAVALAQSPDVMMEKLPLERAESWLKLQRGIFEPRLSATAGYTESDRIQNYWDYNYLRPGEKFLRTDQTRTKSVTAGVNSKLPIGTSVSLDATYGETDSSMWDRTDRLGKYIYPYRETADGRAALTVTQPLLRGFGAQYTMSEIRVARASLETADISWRQSLARRLSGIARAYLDLHAAYDDFDMVRQFEAKARDALAKGEAEETDVQQWAEAREAAAKKISDLQRQLIRQTRERDEWWKDQPEQWVRPLEIHPAACPAVPQNGNLMALVLQAPDYQVAKMRMDSAMHRLRKAKSDLLPKVDVYGRAGLAGFGEDTDAVWEGIENQDRTDWSMGVRVEIGLGGDVSAQAKRDQYNVDYRTAEESLKNLEYDLREQFKGAFEACVDAFAAYEKARDARRVGESYASDRPEYYRTLRQGEIRALALYERSVITLELLQGKFPERYGVRFVERGEVSSGLAGVDPKK